ncbi:MAG: tetratricopeptide repeat protein [Gemmatimonadota bacterium]|nr:tetratricopeptide repeat protein [Gemmatimonadota bacterium]
MLRPCFRFLCLTALLALAACDREGDSRATKARDDGPPSPVFRNVAESTAFVGDARCVSCHAEETAAYRQRPMASSFHRWANDARIEPALDSALYHVPTGLHYAVEEIGGRPHQVEYIVGPGGKRLHELRRPMDYVMGSGAIARTYFTEENGRLFQLPLTWYRTHGWDFSPGYEVNNARFDRLLPDQCIACHSSYPEPISFLEGKYAEMRPGIGCERCHGPGALHVSERQAGATVDTSYDNTIVNPAHLPVERRLDVCEQCHVHTPVTVLREGEHAFSYVPSRRLADHVAFFKLSGGIDIVSHADRLRQSACFLATRTTARPLECATCHDPHATAATAQSRNQSCHGCHAISALQQRLSRSESRSAHVPSADCVTCHMPRVKERGVPHGTFTDHWIRVVSERESESAPESGRSNGRPIEPYYERDATGPDAKFYQAMGEVVYATQANDSRALAAAAAALEAALGADTTRDEARFFLGVAYEQLGRVDAAIRALEQSVRADSSHPERLRALAVAYERAGRSPSVIEPLYRRALSLQPALAWIRAEYADFLHAQGRAIDAAREYRAAIAERPSLAVARFNLGTLFMGMERLRDASTAFREAVRLDPVVAEGLGRLMELRTSGNQITGAIGLDAPISSLPIRGRHPRAMQMAVVSEVQRPYVRFINVPANAFIQIIKPNGALVRALPTGGGGVVTWDLLTEVGAPVAGGLYRVRLYSPSQTDGALTQPSLHFGVVRVRRDG